MVALVKCRPFVYHVNPFRPYHFKQQIASAVKFGIERFFVVPRQSCMGVGVYLDV